jgi:MFS family permease
MPGETATVGEPPLTDATRKWLSAGVAGIGTASLLADVGHEIPTALLPALLISFGAPAASLGLIEGFANGAAGIARLVGGPIADDPRRRQSVALGGYATTAVLSALIGVATSTWQVGALRLGAWTARGLRVPARNALLADLVPASVYGRAYGFERAMDNLGAIGGPLLALALVTLVGTRNAILLSVIPGLLAAASILFAIRQAPHLTERASASLRLTIRPLLHGRLGRLFAGISAFELGNVAATLLILRATQDLAPSFGQQTATQIALGFYVTYNVAATIVSVPAGRFADARGSIPVLAAGALLFAVAFVAFAIGSLPLLAVGFVLGGIAIGCAETAQHAAVAALAPQEVRGSAFGLLAAVQSFGNLTASAVAGVLWTAASPTIAFSCLAACMLVGTVATLFSAPAADSP